MLAILAWRDAIVFDMAKGSFLFLPENFDTEKKLRLVTGTGAKMEMQNLAAFHRANTIRLIELQKVSRIREIKSMFFDCKYE